MNASAIQIEQLAALEREVTEALSTRDTSSLNVLGFGEVSVALGWPMESPRLVCKRLPPVSKNEILQYEQLLTDYLVKLRAAGISVLDTSLMQLDRDGQVIAYLIQPLLAPETLGNNVLKAAEPDPDHPFLAALAQTLDVVSPTLSIDAQVTNFSWDGSALSLIDVGTPFLWDEHGTLLFDITPFGQMIPAPLRSLVIRDLTKIVTRWREPRRVATDIVANLYREGLTDWVDPTITALNRRLGTDDPVTVDEAKAFYVEDLKTWPRLKKLQATQRWWQTSVRRRPYEFFIHSTY